VIVHRVFHVEEKENGQKKKMFSPSIILGKIRKAENYEKEK
jgi:hypothetical protein